MEKPEGQPEAEVAAEEVAAEEVAAEEVAAEQEGAEALLELVLAEHAARAAAPVELPERIDGVVVGRLIALGPEGARVTFPGCPAEGFAARAMASLHAADIDHEVALMFEGGDPRRPVVMGRMATPGAPARVGAQVGAQVDEERIEIAAEKEIVLRCGKSSITLTRAGKILIRGAYVLTRSSGVNRIQGGSVQIN